MSISRKNIGRYCTLFLILYVQSSSSYVGAVSSSSSDALCNKTSYPDFCNTQRPQNKSTYNITDYGRFFIQKSLSSSISLLSAINSHMSPGHSYFQTINYALQDCQFLISLNVDILSNAAQVVGNQVTLQSSQYEDLKTHLSTTITNIDTCFGGIFVAPSSSSIVNYFSPSISNATKLCSISLAFFKNGWIPSTAKSRSLGELLFPFSKSTQRKLLQEGGGVQINKTVVVNPNGSGDYTSINDAIAAAPTNMQSGQGYYQIRVVAGVYQEYISIASNKKYLMIVGDGINQTIITGSHSVGDGWTTFNSATFAVVGQGFIGVNFTVRNTAGAAKYQAVALRNGADTSAFYKCSFEGYQDTLYTHSMRQFYRECDIYGTIDYIFGNAAVVLQLCNIYSRLPLQGQYNTVTAQGKSDINQNTGTSIHDCNIMAADDLASSNGTTQTYLGRPWKTYSTTIVMESFLDSLINPTGWAPWSGNQSLNTLYYAEYNNSGPGSDTSNRVNWSGYHIITNGSDVLNVTVSSSFISGDSWLPSEGVPYIDGLLSYP